ncbi:LOW QUALITY PROTEIN: hypothetical protein KUTeg_008457, partial [Tegillarca granosa]
MDAKPEIFDHPGQKKSVVWRYFGFFKIKENEPPHKNNLHMARAVCKVCRKIYKDNGNTTNFKAHIENEHMLTQSDTSKLQLPDSRSRITIYPSVSDWTGKMGHGKISQSKPKPLMILCAIGKVLPPSVVDNQHFKELVKSIDP